MELIRSNLTNDENFLCIDLVYRFNPCLKHFLANLNLDLFKKYCFNTCRQTAIIGASRLTDICSKRNLDYTFDVYELDCHDVLLKNHCDYIHAVIVATENKTKRRLLIDISRTEQPMVFCEITSSGVISYPKTNGAYEDIIIKNQVLVDWKEMLKEREFFSGLTGAELDSKFRLMTQYLESMEEPDRRNFIDIAYALYTERLQKSIGIKPDIISPLLITQVEEENECHQY